MAQQVVLSGLPPTAMAKLEERARTLGMSIPQFAERLLLRALEEDEVWTTGSDDLPLYKGPVSATMLDHRAARDERMNQLLRGAGEGPR